MKNIQKLFLLILIGVAILGYYYFKQSASSKTSLIDSTPEIIITSADKASDILGVATSALSKTATNIYQKATGSEDEAIINSAVEDITEKVKDLPASQVKKIKYEFCKDIIEEMNAPEEATQ